jgi:hypothetical protein
MVACSELYMNYDDCSESSDDNIGILLEIVTKRSAHIARQSCG